MSVPLAPLVGVSAAGMVDLTDALIQAASGWRMVGESVQAGTDSPSGVIFLYALFPLPTVNRIAPTLSSSGRARILLSIWRYLMKVTVASISRSSRPGMVVTERANPSPVQTYTRNR